MFQSLTQWSLLHRLGPADRAITVRSPEGEERSVQVAFLSPSALSELRSLAPGANLPKTLVDELLAVSDPDLPWTFYYCGEGALYAYLCAPNARMPVRFSMAGLSPEHRRGLRWMVRGERVPREVVQALLTVMPGPPGGRH